MATVALLGRPNVGKSSLFNRIIGERRSIEANEPGTTRDRVYGHVEHRGQTIALIDVAGIGHVSGELESPISTQIKLAQQEAEVLILVVDAIEGLTNEDRSIAKELRKLGKPMVVAANKADHKSIIDRTYQFEELGLGIVLPTSAIHNGGIEDLLDCLVYLLPKTVSKKAPANEISIALVGRPNVGKSTLLNQYAGEDRSITSSVAGTTRDNVDIAIPYKGLRLRFVDTAGIRRAGQVKTGVEHFAVMRSITAIERAQVAVVLIDALEGPTHGDARIAGIAEEAGKGIILAVNKWDEVREQGTHPSPKATEDRPGNREQGTKIKEQGASDKLDPLVLLDQSDDTLQRKFLARLGDIFAYLPYVPVVFISAKTGLHTPKLLEQIRAVHNNRLVMLDQKILDSIKDAAMAGHTHIPLIYQICQIAVAPPTFEVTVNRPETWHFSQLRYIENLVRKAEPFRGAPIKIELKAYAKSQESRRKT